MEVNTTCADCVHFMLIRMKTNYAQPAVQIICADDVHFFVLIRGSPCKNKFAPCENTVVESHLA